MIWEGLVTLNQLPHHGILDNQINIRASHNKRFKWTTSHAVIAASPYMRGCAYEQQHKVTHFYAPRDCACEQQH